MTQNEDQRLNDISKKVSESLIGIVNVRASDTRSKLGKQYQELETLAQQILQRTAKLEVAEKIAKTAADS